MGRQKKRPSLSAFAEKTAQILREAASAAQNKTGTFLKEMGTSSANKIHQIALLLRSEAKKNKKHTKHKD